MLIDYDMLINCNEFQPPTSGSQKFWVAVLKCDYLLYLMPVYRRSSRRTETNAAIDMPTMITMP